MPKKGPQGPQGPQKDVSDGWFTASEKPAPGTPRELLADPPAWLADQVQRYREDPDRHRVSLCRAVAYKVYGETGRWPEIVPILEAVL